MHDPKKPSPTPRKPDEVDIEIPDGKVGVRELPEGPIPGLPVSSDPLLQPMPRPQQRELPPAD